MRPLNDQLMKLAIEAYRYLVREIERSEVYWGCRGDDVDKKDEFHRSRVARENAHYWSSELHDHAKSVLAAIARGETPWPPVRIAKDDGDLKQFKATAVKGFRIAFEKLERVRLYAEELYGPVTV